MNRILTFVTLLVLSGFILPSCGVTLVKRQHRNGYYVNVNPRKPKVDGTKSVETTKQEETAVVIPEVKQEEPVLVAETTTPAENESIAATPAEEPLLATAEVPGDDYQTVVAPSEDRKQAVKKSIFDNAFADKMLQSMPKTKKMDMKIKEMKSSKASPEPASGLSLFWIIILILLILWAVGYWGHWGVGGLIHVLLVIALILLILWLLGII